MRWSSSQLARVWRTGVGVAAVLCGAAAAATAAQGQLVVVLDAAHGGGDTGTHLRPGLEEKDLTLAWSVWLRGNFAAHGMDVVTTREADRELPADRRAAMANGAHAGACLLLHATASGTGVHLYTSSLPPAPAAAAGELVPWKSAQAAFVTDSLKLSSDVSEALAHAGVPVLQGSVSVAPVDSLACPAVLVELAPLVAHAGHAGAAVDDRAYQTRVVDALSAALTKWEGDRRVAPR
jgi:N-acetylmuramoyl-L-alanine amidase